MANERLISANSSNEKELTELDAILNELTRTPMGRRAFLAAVPMLMAACATGEKTRYREGDNSGQHTSITVEDERRMTQEALVEMRKDYPALKDPELQNYVRGVGDRIVRANGLAGNPYHYNFTVVDVAQVNAFALPAGTVFVTAPLIAMADTEAELAGVIGHEIGHVQARHAAERIDKAQKESNKTWLYAVGGTLIGGVAGFGLGKLICPPRDRECLSRAATLGAAAGASGGLLVQKYKFMANSREDEMEADRIGFRTSVRAGYDAGRVGDFYAKLLKMEEQNAARGNNLLSAVADAMSTHPPSRERIAQMQELASAEPRKAKAIVSSQEFERARKRIQEHLKSKSKA